MLTQTFTQRSMNQISLLICGACAGPLYIVVALAQALMRPGFDLARHDVSLLSLGAFGWIQTANFLASGGLAVAGALGLRRSLGSSWGTWLIAAYGAGVMGGGLFSADPALGFPPGTPLDASPVSGHGVLHLVSAAIGFLALIVATFVLSRRFARRRERGWAAYSLATGVVFLLSFLGISVGRPIAVAAGFGIGVTVLGLWVGVILGWAWISALSVRAIGADGFGPAAPAAEGVGEVSCGPCRTPTQGEPWPSLTKLRRLRTRE